MARATWLLGATALIAVSLSVWLYLDNRSLRAELAERPSVRTAAAPAATVAARPAERATPSARTATPIARAAAPEPALPDQPTESRMDRRARRTDEVAALLGRLDGETEEEYRARLLPMLSAGLAVPRLRVEEQRKVAQDKAHV